MVNNVEAWLARTIPALSSIVVVFFLFGLVYSRHYLKLDLRTQSITKQHSAMILSFAADIADDIGHLNYQEEERAKGRYGKSIRKLGVVDVLIAVRALRAKAILVTGDWNQAKFYLNIASKKLKEMIGDENKGQPLIYIPVKLLG